MNAAVEAGVGWSTQPARISTAQQAVRMAAAIGGLDGESVFGSAAGAPPLRCGALGTKSDVVSCGVTASLPQKPAAAEAGAVGQSKLAYHGLRNRLHGLLRRVRDEKA